MKILLDENIDVHFKEELTGYEIKTVKDKGWTGTENGELLTLAVSSKFDVFITLDSNLRYQQNLSIVKIHIIILKANDSRLANIKLFTPKIRSILDTINNEKKYEVIEISI